MDITPLTSSETPQPRARTRRGCCGCALLALLLSASTVVWLIYPRSVTRFRVVGPTDPITGCRMEYTVSSRYFLRKVRLDPSGILGHAEIAPIPPPKWIDWAENHLRSKSPTYSATAGNILAFGRQISPRRMKTEDLWQSQKSNADKPPSSAASRNIEFQHITVSQCTALWLVTEWQGKGPGYHKFRSYTLLVHPVHKPVTYSFDGFAEGAEDQQSLRKEMIAIRDSIKITGL